MQRTLTVIITVGALVVAAGNAVNLIAIGSNLMLIWALAFCIGMPIISVAQAVRLARSETVSPWQSRSSLVISGLLLAQMAMLPLAEELRELDAQCERGD